MSGGRPRLVPGRDLLLTWLQGNYSRQLERDLPSETTLVLTHLVAADSTAAQTYSTAPLRSAGLRVSTESRRMASLSAELASSPAAAAVGFGGLLKMFGEAYLLVLT